MKLKKILAGVLASAMTLTAEFVPAIVNETAPLFQSAITASAAEYSNIGEFFDAAEEVSDCEFFDGTDDENYMVMKGRKYYQGIKIVDYVILNVENVNKLSFDVCKIDGTSHRDTTLYVEADEKKLLELPVTADDAWKHIDLNVSKEDSVRLYIDQDWGEIIYGLGDFTIDDMPVAMPHTVPYYKNASDFINSSDNSLCESCDGTDEDKYIEMKGRKYYQGVAMCPVYNGAAYMIYNVENVSKISFELCRVDNSNNIDRPINVFRNGVWWQDITITGNELWKEISLDVSKVDTIGFYLDSDLNDAIAYGLGNFTIDDLPVEMNYTIPSYDTALDFLNYGYNKNRAEIFDGSNTFKNIVINGKEYCQGLELGAELGISEFNVENVDSMTFTLGRVDDSWENDICLDIYKDGKLWYQLKQPVKQAATQYRLNLKDTSNIIIHNIGGSDCGLMYLAINDDYSAFTDGTYDFTEEVYTDPSKITDICVHNYEGNKCTLCGLVCEHKFEKSVCTVCGFKCTHEYDEGVCKVCGHECTHTFEDGVCIFCNLKCRHIYEGSKCKVCGVVCEHEAYKYGYCEECGIECAHEYNKNGKCAVCGMNIRGDISDNGKIDLYDAIEIAKSLIGKRKFTEEERITADFNKDGKVDLHDAIEIAKYILKK